MSLVIDFGRQSLAALRILIVFTVLLGVAYPVGVWAFGRLVPSRADGQLVVASGEIVGSALLGQSFDGPQWFHGRPSAGGYDPMASGASNLGPSNPDLLEAIVQRRVEVAAAEGVDPSAVPADALTASASGLDPEISVEYARLQAPRVARENGLALQTVTALIDESTRGRQLGFLGEPGVNVLALNLGVAAVAGGAD